jgi:phosphoribosyl 1,2-cyclic phosphate phosphodiesterase
VTITVLGSGTSSGVPMIGCHCAVCTSGDPRDNRLRPSIAIQHGKRTIIIDITPDFRYQALRSKLPRVDAILFTHSHADHIMGLDDVRPFNFHQGGRIPIYGAEDTISTVRTVFHYIFDAQAKASFVPQLDTHVHNGQSVDVFGLEFQPIRVLHGKLGIYGYRFGNAAYLTDHSVIPEESIEQLRGLDVLFLDALRHKPHPTHSTVETSRETIKILDPKRAFLTHLSHDLPHAETEAGLPAGVFLAYDGLVLEVD